MEDVKWKMTNDLAHQLLTLSYRFTWSLTLDKLAC